LRVSTWPRVTPSHGPVGAVSYPTLYRGIATAAFAADISWPSASRTTRRTR
jgi:hypothetical protein